MLYTKQKQISLPKQHQALSKFASVQQSSSAFVAERWKKKSFSLLWQTAAIIMTIWNYTKYWLIYPYKIFINIDWLIDIFINKSYIDKRKECLVLWTKACATALPCHTTWEKEILWKEFFKIEMSWMRWPPCMNSQPPSWIALITKAESPSNTTLEVSVLREKVIARLAAKMKNNKVKINQRAKIIK